MVINERIKLPHDSFAISYSGIKSDVCDSYINKTEKTKENYLEKKIEAMIDFLKKQNILTLKRRTEANGLVMWLWCHAHVQLTSQISR